MNIGTRIFDREAIKDRLKWLAEWEKFGPLDQEALRKADVLLGKAAHPAIRALVEQEWNNP